MNLFQQRYVDMVCSDSPLAIAFYLIVNERILPGWQIRMARAAWEICLEREAVVRALAGRSAPRRRSA